MPGPRWISVFNRLGTLGPNGQEIVTNGNFTVSTGWTLTGGATITGGVLQSDGSGVGKAERAPAIPIEARNYNYSFDIVTAEGGVDFFTIRVGGTSQQVPGSLAATSGHFTGTIASTAANQLLSIESAQIYQIDNLSILTA